MQLRREAIRSLQEDCDVIDERSSIKQNFFKKPPRDPSVEKTTPQSQHRIDRSPKKHLRASLQPLSVSNSNIKTNETSYNDRTESEMTDFVGSGEDSLLRDVSSSKNPFEDSEHSDTSKDENVGNYKDRVKIYKNPFDESSESSLELRINKDIDEINNKETSYNENLNPFLNEETTNSNNSLSDSNEDLKDNSYDDSKNPFA